MRSNRLKAAVIGLIVLVGAGAFSVYAASNYGSQDDPLITKSYLDSVVRPELQESMRSQMESSLAEIELDDGEFRLVTLSSGQTAVGSVGTELILRFGSAQAYAYDPDDVALVDTTSAASLVSGQALSANHLCMVTIAGNGFTAGEDGAKVLISGGYTIR